MPTPRDNDTDRAEALHTRVIRLQETLRFMEEQREHLIRRRRRHVLIVGVGISLVVHLSLMYFLASRYRLTGGNIRNVALTAAFLAARDGGIIDLEHLLWATRREYQKMGRLADEREFVE